MDRQWVLYILECKDGSLYTGITDNLPRRLAAHRSGKGAKYTRGRGPLTLRYVERCEDRSQALRRECQIKALKKQDKMMLIQASKLDHSELEEI